MFLIKDGPLTPLRSSLSPPRRRPKAYRGSGNPSRLSCKLPNSVAHPHEVAVGKYGRGPSEPNFYFHFQERLGVGGKK